MSLESVNLHTTRKDRLAVPQVSWNHFFLGNPQHRSLVLEAIGWVGHDLATEQNRECAHISQAHSENHSS